jgi:hypothetical protein
MKYSSQNTLPLIKRILLLLPEKAASVQRLAPDLRPSAGVPAARNSKPSARESKSFSWEYGAAAQAEIMISQGKIPVFRGKTLISH